MTNKNIYYFVNDNGEFLRSSFSNDGEGVLVDGAPENPNQYWSFDDSKWKDIDADELAWASARAERDALLLRSDWTQVPDSPLSENQDWKEYRQALRDITSDFPSPGDIVWPEKPSGS